MIDWKKSAELNNVTIEELKVRFRRFPHSCKRIIAICENEECKKERIISYDQYRDLCVLCAHNTIEYCKNLSELAIERWSDTEKRKNLMYKHSSENMIGDISDKSIDWITTEKETGFNIEYFERCPNSHEKVFAICKIGGKGRWVPYYAYRDLCKSCTNKKRFEDPKEREKSHESFLGRNHNEKTIKLMSDIKIEKYKDIEERILQSCRLQGISREKWNGFTIEKPYCNLFNKLLKESVREYFNLKYFMDNEPEENGNALCIHHVNYDKRCGCNATHLCIFVPVKAKWNLRFNGTKEKNRWCWYQFLMIKIFTEHPNYFTYHIPVWGMSELEYNYNYVFEKFRRK